MNSHNKGIFDQLSKWLDDYTTDETTYREHRETAKLIKAKFDDREARLTLAKFIGKLSLTENSCPFFQSCAQVGACPSDLLERAEQLLRLIITRTQLAANPPWFQVAASVDVIAWANEVKKHAHALSRLLAPNYTEGSSRGLGMLGWLATNHAPELIPLTMPGWFNAGNIDAVSVYNGLETDSLFLKALGEELACKYGDPESSYLKHRIVNGGQSERVGYFCRYLVTAMRNDTGGPNYSMVAMLGSAIFQPDELTAERVRDYARKKGKSP